MKNFQFGRGSVTGPHHIESNYNNQDGLFIGGTEDYVVGVVCDGCSGGPYSEVGARWGAYWLGMNIPRILFDTPGDPTTLIMLNTELCVALKSFLNSLTDNWQNDHKYLISRYGLFTYLAFYMLKDQSFIFGVGDGVFCFNNEWTIIDTPLTEDGKEAPDYPAYHLVPEMYEQVVDPTLFAILDNRDINSIAVGSDGLQYIRKNKGQLLKNGKIVDDLTQFSNDNIYAGEKSSLALQKKLTILQRQKLLFDDTTIILGRRKNEMQD